LTLDLAQERVVQRLQDAVQVQIPCLGLAHGNDSHRPFEVRAGFIEIKLRQGPILLLTSEPEVGEVITDIGHGVRLVRHLALERFQFRVQGGDIRRLVRGLFLSMRLA
jgi:hypothetical protein